ncbi:hypothetical protein JEQ12_003390 [Ovis aries]|uniref:Protein phosphatase 1E n=1 Tax=Ovis aries TaxID=9940 RepID=A0A835ZWW7_SHEEP|nr:hypothetical protein JEQ12_003390 [Ovis aries]
MYMLMFLHHFLYRRILKIEVLPFVSRLEEFSEPLNIQINKALSKQKEIEKIGKKDKKKIETVKLARSVFSKLHEICCSWVKDFPLRRRPQLYYETSIHAIKNMRRKMEDKHVCIPDFNMLFNLEDQEEQAYFAVFDGHGGVDAAIYASIHLHVNLVRQEMFPHDPAEALCRAFRVTDERFVQKAARESLRCGTTGVVTFIRGNMLHVAWVGDSQVMLVRKGQAVELMKPHKPDREDEKQRIEALGGCVVWFGAWRVNGSLSVSRAIGDAEHKPYICGDADSASTVLDGTEDYLILACDGFYDTVNPDEAVKVVSDHLKENNGDSSMVAHNFKSEPYLQLEAANKLIIRLTECSSRVLRITQRLRRTFCPLPVRRGATGSLVLSGDAECSC